MKTFLIILIFLTTFLGCARNNAFESFGFTPEQELSEIYTRSSKIKKDDSVDGIVSVVYLNKIYPNVYKDAEYFYVNVYRKEKLHPINFELNALKPSKTETLQAVNEFSRLIPSNSSWKEHYMIVFEEQGDILSLVVKSGLFGSDELLYEKDE